MFLITTTILGLTFLINSVLFIFIVRSRNPGIVQTIFLVHLAAIACWSLFLLCLLLYASIHTFPQFTAHTVGYDVAKAVFVAATILFATNYWFVHYFIYETFKHTILNYFMIGTQMTALVLSVTNNTLYTTFAVEPAGFITVMPGPLNGVYSIFLLSHLVVPLVILYKAKRKSTGQMANQIKTLFVYYLIFLAMSMLFNWILPVYFNIFNFNAFGPTTSVILVIGIIYAIMRYEFLDIRLIIQRGLIYTIIFAFIVALYSSMLAISSVVFSDSLLLGQTFTSIFVTIIALITVPRIDTYLRRVTDPIFFKGRYSYRDVLEELSELLQSSLEMDALVEACEQKLQQALRASFVTIADKTNPAGAATLQIPIKLQDKLTGVVLVGEKVSGDRYTDDDRQLLHTFANQAATAMSRVLLYQEVRRRADELEMRVAQRTAELQSLQEKQKSMMLQISHNLQTPLTILQTKIDDLSQKPGLTDVATNLTRSLRDLSEFISELLKFARLESKQVEFSMQPLDLSQTLDELLEEIGIIASDNDVQVVHTIKSDLHVLGDERKLREVFMNILSNALKYMRIDSAKTITVTTEKTDAGICCHIADTGIGLSATQTAKIFDRFYRAGGSDASGTGLGLAISKEIIEQHNGTISVTSEIGVGSVFTICLPMHEVQ